MNRDDSLSALRSPGVWDIVVIGGGASGLGAAVDAASRGYRTVLVDQHDFANATSSRSTKLIHGGVRYLRQGNISLVRDSLRERALLLENAPHLTKSLSFVVPVYSRSDQLFYGMGLKLYDRLAGKLSLGSSTFISAAETLRELPTIQTRGLRGGIRYYDGQFDDARLAVALAQTLHDLGGWAANYVKVVRLLKAGGKISGVHARDVESGAEFEIRARVVVNATGVRTDSVRQLDEPQAKPLVTASQGSHVVLHRSFLPGTSALMIPKTKDGRVLFAIPWYGCVVVGTTDTPVPIGQEPRPLPDEIAFLLEHTAHYLTKAPTQADILSAFAGLRPLVKGAAARTSQLSRDHSIVVSENGLVTLTGGKWTTYRKMGEDVITRAAEIAGLEPRPSRTHHLRLHGGNSGRSELDVLPTERVTESSIAEFARNEMARTVEDVLARRTRLLITDQKAALKIAPFVASVLARELRRGPGWEQDELNALSEPTRCTRVGIGQ